LDTKVLFPAVAGYMEQLRVTQGEGAGDCLELMPWQRRFLRGVLAANCRTAGLSIARGNGKSTLIAGLATAALTGPLRQSRGECVVVASSFQQARVVFEHVLAFADPNRREYKIQDSANNALVEHKMSGARVRCIGSDPRRAHGLAPYLALLDEPAQWEPAKTDRMRAAMRTGLGKVPGSRMIALGTRPEDPTHWFSQLLAGKGDYAQLHTAGPGDPPFQKRTWLKANPSLPYMPDLEAAIRDEAIDARQDENELAAFRALRLNLGTADVRSNNLVTPETWQQCEALPAEAAGPSVWGIDLGQNAAMSAVACYWPETGRLEARACFPARPSLQERERSDQAAGMYMAMHRRGELLVEGDRVSDIAALLAHCRQAWGEPAALVADRWREAELKQVLEAMRFPWTRLVIRGQGFKDGSEDVRAFRKGCLHDQVRPEQSLLLRHALSNARVIGDPAGNWKLSKGTQGGRRAVARDDAAAAAILAVSAGIRMYQGASEPGPILLGVA
ncbi:MAG: terminase large subunit, partial [Chloroflexota bacterium]|nr:terminase large subunit [Chloroflexota bacterium]